MITPLSNRIIVKRCDPETKSAGGIIIQSSEKRDEGIVLAVGPKAMTVKTNNRVIFGSHVGTTIKTEEGDCLAMREDDLIAIID